jgi:LuxR family maltose regulon positive regulatory protein
MVYVSRAELEFARGRDQEALAACRTAERLAELLIASRPLTVHARAFRLQTLVRMGETVRAEAALAKLSEQERESGQMRIALAVLRLAQDDPRAASLALAPILEGITPVFHPNWLVVAFLLEAIARDVLGENRTAQRALERALDLAEPNGVLLPFLLHPAGGLLERHRGPRTAHTALISDILNLLAGRERVSPPGGQERLRGPLSDSETRVLRYLPTNLSAPEIAAELYLSVNTVKTHVRHLYDKLGTHNRGETVERARALGLLAPSSRRG